MVEGETRIYRKRGESGEELVGRLAPDGTLYRLRWGEGKAVGRADDEHRVFRTTTHGESELGRALPTGAIYSAGLFEGGEAGWMEPDGLVIQAGLIFGEEEIGRVQGPHALAAAAALLLLFAPDEAESERRSQR